MSDVRVALIGCGGMGKGLVTQLKTIEDAVLVAGADPLEEARSKFAEAFEAPTFESLDQLLAEVEVDGVIVAVPNDLHAPLTIQAAEAGKHVFCEKPMSLTLASCRAMIDACHKAGVKLQVGQVLRYLPDFQKTLAMIAAGELGEPRHGAIFRTGRPTETWGRAWRNDPARCGHYLFEVAVHELDFARCVFGKPVAVSGWDTPRVPGKSLWSQATTAVIEFESGAVCVHVEGMFNPIGRSEMEICGTLGAVKFHWGHDFVFKPVGEGEGWEKTGAEISEGLENGLRREIREWLEAIRCNTATTIPGEEGMANIELALAILESNRRKARVELPLEG
jgi:UDP-N-acetylglucosamine 3-dehydrogenase